ncbi:MAG: hypothetical protein U0X86_001274 [Wolbachia endosymbiont of Xenopsylla cheopis]
MPIIIQIGWSFTFLPIKNGVITIPSIACPTIKSDRTARYINKVSNCDIAMSNASTVHEKEPIYGIKVIMPEIRPVSSQ